MTHPLALLLLMLLLGVAVGLWLGRRIWGPKWYDTSEGIDREFRKMGRFL